MPTYDYRCSSCGEQQEVFQKITDSSLTTCPQCHQETFSRRPAGGIGLAFTGDGFYATMYGEKQNSPDKQGCCPCGKDASSCG